MVSGCKGAVYVCVGYLSTRTGSFIVNKLCGEIYFPLLWPFLSAACWKEKNLVCSTKMKGVSFEGFIQTLSRKVSEKERGVLVYWHAGNPPGRGEVIEL